MSQQVGIAIFGANGFVGRWLLNELKSRPNSPNVWPLVDHESIDITDRQAVRGFIGAVRPQVVVNLAAIAAPGEAASSPDLAWEVNFGGTRNIASAILEVSPDTRLIQVGSADVYGLSVNSTLADEERPLNPISTYGATKAAADIFVGQLTHEGLHAVRFRPFNHTGPGQTAAYVVPAFARQIAKIAAGRQPPIVDVGNISAYRDFLDVRDVVRAYSDVALAGDRFPENQVFNLSSGAPIMIGEILERLASMAGLSISVRTDPARTRSIEASFIGGNSSKAERVIGWRPTISWEQTLRDVLDDWTEQIRHESA